MLIVCANACLTLSFIKSNIIITMHMVDVLAIYRRRFVSYQTKKRLSFPAKSLDTSRYKSNFTIR